MHAISILCVLVSLGSVHAEHAEEKKYPELMKLLDDPEPNVRWEAIRALALAGHSDALPKILEMVLSHDLAFRGRDPRDFVLMLPNFGPDALPVLAVIAKTGLQRLDRDAIERFERLRVEPFSSIAYPRGRIAACVGLSKLGDPRGVPILLDVLRKVERVRPVVRPGDMPATPRHRRSDWLRQTVPRILTALGEIGLDDPKVVAALERYRRHFPVEVDTALRRIEAAKKKKMDQAQNQVDE